MPELHPMPGTANPTLPRPRGARGNRTARASYVERWRRASLDRAARKAHADLLRAYSIRDASRTGWREIALRALSLAVLAVSAGALGLLAWATVQPKGPWGWAGIVIGWVVVVRLVPRPRRLAAVILPRDAYPATHRLVAKAARAMSVRPPARIGVSADFVTYVTRTGWTLRPVLVIGLPCWTALPPDQRLALLAHELGHLRGRGRAVGLLVAHAHDLLERFATLLTPLPRDGYSDREDLSLGVRRSRGPMSRLGSTVLRLLSVPAVLLLLLFERLAVRDSQRREYVADICAAEIAGTHATVRLVLAMSNSTGARTVATAAVHRHENPFTALAALAQRPALTPAEVAEAGRRARETGARWDGTHPRDDLRVGLLSARPIGASWSAAEALESADAELARMQPELAHDLRAGLLGSHA